MHHTNTGQMIGGIPIYENPAMPRDMMVLRDPITQVQVVIVPNINKFRLTLILQEVRLEARQIVRRGISRAFPDLLLP